MTLEDRIREIVREELRALAPRQEAEPLLVTVPRAARLTSISADTIRSWIADGRLPRRTKNLHENAKRPVFLVALDEVRRAAAGELKPPSDPVSLAAHRLASRLR